MPSRKELAIMLSKLEQFDNPKVLLEQYSTDPEVAADMLWTAYMNGDIEGKSIADLGCGPGIFGIGAAVLCANRVIFVDMDENAIKTAKQNLKLVKPEADAEFVLSDVCFFSTNVDVVLMNPPFGTRIKHHDRLFLGKAFELARVVYSIHKLTSKGFIDAFSQDSGFRVTHIAPYKMRLVRSMKHHKKPVGLVEVGCWRIERVLY
jgi:putative methylase